MNAWLVIAGLAAATAALRVAGIAFHAERALGTRIAYVAPAVLAGLVATGTLAENGSLTVDERIPAMVVAAVGAHRRWPFLAIVASAAATAALLRLAL